MRKAFIAAFMIVPLVFAAQTQVATVTSSAPFTMGGASVSPNSGVPNWPVLAGSSVKAGTAPTVVSFPDGSAVVLMPSSEATIGRSGLKPVFHLVAGSAQFNLKSTGSVEMLSAKNAVVVPPAVAGTLGPDGLMTAGSSPAALAEAAIIAIAGGAAMGMGLGIGLATTGGKSVSP